MTDAEKINLIRKLIGDFWDFNNDDQQEMGAFAVVTAIHSIVTFGGDGNV